MCQLNSTGDLETPIRRQLHRSETLPGPDWHKLYRWLVSQSSAFLPYHTVYLVTDNRDLQSDKVKSVPGLSHWPMVAAWWKERYACVFLFPTINFALIDSDCVPVTLFEIRELWLASTDPTRPATSSKAAKSKLSSPIASSHKRARSVDTGRDMQLFFRPTPYSFRQVVQHVSKHVADEIN